MRVRTITVGGIVGLLLGCALPLAGKTACATSADCIDARVCVDGQCRDGACETWCAAICDAVGDCDDGSTAGCESRCLAGDAGEPAFVPTLAASACKDVWDAWPADDACDGLACVNVCAPSCELARSCALIVDEAACFTGCIAMIESCDAIPSDCVSVPDEVLCWEDASACQ
jgi:hypothetical protein